MKVRVLVGLLVFLVVLNLAAIGTFLFFMAKKPERSWGPPEGMRRGMERGTQLFVDMDPEDREQLRELAMAFRESTRELGERSRDLEDQVLELMREEDVQRAKVDSLVQEIAEVRLEIGRKAIDHLIETRSFLTPEQQEIFHSMILRQGGGRRGPPGFDGRGPRKGK